MVYSNYIYGQLIHILYIEVVDCYNYGYLSCFKQFCHWPLLLTIFIYSSKLELTGKINQRL